MVEQTRQPSSEEQEFWDRQFVDPPRRGRQPAAALATSRRERRQVISESLLTRLVDRCRDWRHDARFGVVLLVGVALVAGVIWYRIGIGGASAGESSAAPTAVSTTAPSTTLDDPTPTDAAATATATGTKGRSATIVVHVAGAVNHPGVVELKSGARVIDAVEAVGGARVDGDLDRLNLAAKVTDGQRVYVAKVGQSDPGAAGDGAGSAAGGDPASDGTTAGKVNLNTATQAQLEQLPGIGPTYAQSIIAERQRRGGFTSVNDLRSVRGIGDKRFAELAPLVTV
jgi:competence protein ComEA